VADTSRHPQVQELKTQHYQWLLQTAQQDKAAAVKELEGDYLAAISLYLKGGLPARAAQVLVQTTRPSHSLHMCCTTISPAAVHIVLF
jgi:intraflagellar transport protein 172